MALKRPPPHARLPIAHKKTRFAAGFFVSLKRPVAYLAAGAFFAGFLDFFAFAMMNFLKG